MEAGIRLGLCNRDCDTCQALVITGCPHDTEVIDFMNACNHRELHKGQDGMYYCDICGKQFYPISIIDLTRKDDNATGNI